MLFNYDTYIIKKHILKDTQIYEMNIGVDLSINSTGLVFVFKNKNKEQLLNVFYNIIPQELLTKGKKNKDIITTTYVKDYDKDSYSSEDLSKVMSGYRLGKKINELINENIEKFKPSVISARMEGSLLSTRFSAHQSRLNDLTCYNSITKLSLLSNIKIKTFFIIPPTTLKKYAVGKGNAKKDAIIEQFFTEFPNFDTIGKLDDIADAYYLAKSDFDIKLGYGRS